MKSESGFSFAMASQPFDTEWFRPNFHWDEYLNKYISGEGEGGEGWAGRRRGGEGEEGERDEK